MEMFKKTNHGMQTVKDFVKVFSCSYSTTKNLSSALGMKADPILLKAVTGFASGIAAFGETCGAVNGGIVVLGKKFPDNILSSPLFYMLCSEYYNEIESRAGAVNCGQVHGGKHLANNFRRAILTGKAMKCMNILKHGADILITLNKEVEEKNFTFIKNHDFAGIEKITGYFEDEAFHCCCNVINEISTKTDINALSILDSARGFIGGIGFNGTICGTVIGGILCAGLITGADLNNTGFMDTIKIIGHGLKQNDKIFTNEKHFPAAKTFKLCREIHDEISDKYGSIYCKEILGQSLDTTTGANKYIESQKINTCRDIARTVAEKSTSLFRQYI